jgi:hypothetical protein
MVTRGEGGEGHCDASWGEVVWVPGKQRRDRGGRG